jgi:hypothetical protein
LLQLVVTYFKTAMQKLIQDDAPGTDQEKQLRRHAMLDLCIAIAMHADLESINLLYRFTISSLKDPDTILQKKSYKFLGLLAGSNPEFVRNNLQDFESKLAEATLSCAAGSKTVNICGYFLFSRRRGVREFILKDLGLTTGGVLKSLEPNPGAHGSGEELALGPSVRHLPASYRGSFDHQGGEDQDPKLRLRPSCRDGTQDEARRHR